jgi:hypothetical protein
MAGLARSPARFADRPAVIAGAGLALVLHGLKHGVGRAQMLRSNPPSEEIAERSAGAAGKGHCVASAGLIGP